MKKKIISNTLFFIVMMAFLLLFKSIFTENNMLIGVMSFTALLMFLSSDLTAEPLKNTVTLVLFFVCIGIGSFITTRNIYLAVPINFIIIFCIIKKFGYILKAPLYLPFVFMYLFLISEPIPFKDLPLRLISLVTGALLIMIAQFIVNKNKIKKVSDKTFSEYINLLIQKIDLINDKSKVEEINLKAFSLVTSLKVIIYERKEKHFYISEDGKVSLNVLVSLEKLNYLIDKVNKDKSSTITLEDLRSYLIFILTQLNSYNKENLIEFIDNIVTKNKDTSNTLDLQIMSNLIFIKNSIIDYKDNKKKLNLTEIRNVKKDAFTLKDIKFNSIQVAFALRLSILVTVTCFIMQYFKLDQGRWIIFTVFSLTTPYYEKSIAKSKDRFVATLIAAFIVSILFTVVTDSTLRGLLMLFIGYLNMYAKTYKSQIIIGTLSSVAMAAMTTPPVIGDFGQAGPITLALIRICYVLIGTVIALIINKFIFSYNVAKANANLDDSSSKVLKDLCKNLKNIIDKKNLDSYVNNSYLLVSHIEKTILENIELLKDKSAYNNYYDISDKKMQLASSIYEFTNLIKSYNLNEKENKYLKEIIDSIPKTYKAKDRLFIDYKLDIKVKIILSYLYEIVDDTKILKEDYLIQKEEVAN